MIPVGNLNLGLFDYCDSDTLSQKIRIWDFRLDSHMFWAPTLDSVLWNLDMGLGLDNIN